MIFRSVCHLSAQIALGSFESQRWLQRRNLRRARSARNRKTVWGGLRAMAVIEFSDTQPSRLVWFPRPLLEPASTLGHPQQQAQSAKSLKNIYMWMVWICIFQGFNRLVEHRHNKLNHIPDNFAYKPIPFAFAEPQNHNHYVFGISKFRNWVSKPWVLSPD